MPERLTFKNGYILTNSSAILSGSLFLYMRGISIRKACDLLIEPLNTAEIVYTQMNGDTAVYEGYTKLTAVRDEGGGLITAVLDKGE